MITIPYNQINSSIATLSSQNLAYPVNNLDDVYGSQVMKFTGYADENIVFDAGVGNTIDFDAIGIENHNFSSGVTITIQGNAADSWGSPSFDETVTYRENTIYQYYNTTSSYRFARLRIEDAGNSTALQIGYLSLGLNVNFPSINSSIDLDTVNNGLSYIGDSGQAGGNSKWSGRVFTLQSDYITLAEKLVLRTIKETNGTYQPIFCMLYDDDYDNEAAVYCILEIGDFKRTGQVYTCSFNVVEVN